MPISTNLNVIPFGLYNMLLGMYCLYLQRSKVGCYEKAIECLDDDGEKRILQGEKKLTLVRMVIAMQEKHTCKKGCVFFAVHASSNKGKDVEDVEVLKRNLIFIIVSGCIFNRDFRVSSS